jgi:hypothetical protein
MRAAGDLGDFGAAVRQPCAEIAADAARSHNGNSQRLSP